MAKNMPQQDPEDVRTDLMAAMAASRELGPEMDKALVDSYMERHHPVSAQQPAAQAVTQPEQRPQSADLIGFAGMGIGIVAFIALLMVSHGALWWMFWPIMCWGGWRWWGGGHDEYRQSRMEYRTQQREMRMQRRAARYGLPYQYRYTYEYGYGEQQPPQAQQSQQAPESPRYQAAPAPTSAPAIPPTPAPAPQQQQMQPPSSSATPQPPVNPAG